MLFDIFTIQFRINRCLYCNECIKLLIFIYTLTLRSRIWRLLALLLWKGPVYFRVRVETVLTRARLCVRTEFSREQNIVNQRGASEAEWGTPRCLTVNETFCLKPSKKKRSEFGGGTSEYQNTAVRTF